MAFEIHTATRVGSKLVTGFVGESGSGKTLTALLMALGMAKQLGGRVGFIDTENGRSGLYADEEEIMALGGFDKIDLTAPFTPERYLEAIKTFEEKGGYPVLVIDTISHEWNNTGGVVDMVDNSTVKNDFAKWKAPKQKHSKFFNALLQSKCHIMLCYRAKEKLRQVKDDDGKTAIVSEGLKPVQDAMMIYDMTTSFMMHDSGHADHIKVPRQLKPLFPNGQRLGVEHGKMLAEWVQGGEPLDERLAELKDQCRASAATGMVSLKAWYTEQTEGDRVLIRNYLDNDGKSIAKAYDSTPTATFSRGDALTGQIEAEAMEDARNAGMDATGA